MCIYSFFIGCDMSKDSFDVAFHNGIEVTYLGLYTNNIKGFKRMVKDLKTMTDVPCGKWFFCFENTGVYSKALLEWLFSQQIACREENALQISKSLGLIRGKNDKADSIRICRYAFEKRDSIKPSALTKPSINKLKTLLSRRDLFLRQKLSLEKSLKEKEQVTDPDFYQEMCVDNEKLIKKYLELIKKIEHQVKELIQNDEQMQTNDKLARSIVGIGPIISAFLIATTHNYERFSNARQYACYCGVAPFPNQSGKRFGKTRVSQMANKRMKSLLSNGILSAIRYDREIAVYHKRKRAEGKEKGVVYNAIKNKIIQRVFAVIKRQTPYVKIVQYA